MSRGSSTAGSGAVTQVEGRAIPLRGDDIDTDRIMPARFLKAVSFEGLERHVFEDDRASNPSHPFNDGRYAGAALLVVNKNFGFRAIVGESFSEIFQGNAVMLGMPCFVADHASIDALQGAIERHPSASVTADVASGRVRADGVEIHASLPPAVRDAFLTGQWNPTVMLLDRFDEVRAVAERLPYVSGF